MSISSSFRITDAKYCDLEPTAISSAIESIAAKELAREQGTFKASDYITRTYFMNDRANPGSAEVILLARDIHDLIIGFIILENPSVSRHLEGLNIAYVPYLAVDSSVKKQGIGTALMLGALSKAKELGYRYLNLEYVLRGDEVRDQAKSTFYNSFRHKFNIITTELSIYDLDGERVVEHADLDSDSYLAWQKSKYNYAKHIHRPCYDLTTIP